MRNRRQPTERQLWFLALFAVALGAIAIADSFGYLAQLGMQPRRRATVPAPPWVETAMGLVFVFMGIGLLLQQYKLHVAVRISTVLVLLGFLVVFGWSAVAYH